jgi:death-on-curing protein
MPVIYLDVTDILLTSRMITGEDLVRDIGLVESACARPRASVFGEDAYPGIWEKAAALLQSLACNHGFTDGNKRTAWAATAAFLDLNGHPLGEPFDVGAADDLVLAVATGTMRDVPAIASALVKFFG